MKNEYKKNKNLLGLAGIFACARCGGETPPTPAPEMEIEIGFASPLNNSVMPSEFLIEMYAEGVTITSIDRQGEGSGYFAIALDGRCVPPGSFVPFSFPYLHLVGGEMLLWVSLFPGAYDLCLMVIGPDGRTLLPAEHLRFLVQ